jgi:GAF domain-containing protein
MVVDALETLLRNAVAATGADRGWIVVRAALGGLQVRAYCGPDDPARYLGATFEVAAAGTAGLAAGSGQPIAVRPRPGDVLVAQGPMSLLVQPPASYVSVPCSDDDGVVGVLEVVDKQAAASFDIDDIELLSLLGDVAAALIREREERPPAASALGPLEALQARRPMVHQAIVGLIEALDAD